MQSPAAELKAAGSSHSSDLSDSESVDTNRSDGIVSEYCKPAAAKVTNEETGTDSSSCFFSVLILLGLWKFWGFIFSS